MLKKTNRFSYLLEKIKSDLRLKDIDLAECIKVTPPTISNWLNSNAMPRGKNISQIAKILFKELEIREVMNVDYCNRCLNELVYSYDLPSEKIIKIKKLIEKYELRKAFMDTFNLVYEEDMNKKAPNNAEIAESCTRSEASVGNRNAVDENSGENIVILAEYIAKMLFENNQINLKDNLMITNQGLSVNYIM